MNQHSPDAFDEDLHPGGQTFGPPRTAFDLKDAHRALAGITDDGLQQIPLVPQGTRLDQGATYIDLRDPLRREFTATADMVASETNWYVAKHGVDYELWNVLIRVSNPERLYSAPGTGEAQV